MKSCLDGMDGALTDARNPRQATMISVEEALKLILEKVPTRPSELVPLEALTGRVLAEEISSDLDSPPHDKSMVDGYAVQRNDLAELPVTLGVLEEVTAGEVPRSAVQPGQATRIMTGAPVPSGADAVVMVEQTSTSSDADGIESVTIGEVQLPASGNIMPQGTSLRAGDVVLKPGRTIRPLEIGLLAEVGRHQVQVSEIPSVAVLSTGNELVDVNQSPQPGQIRNSNGPMLGALASRAGAKVVSLGIGRDRMEDLRQAISQGLQEDVLVLSGGVSAGVLDLVPQVLQELGVEQVFHKVAIKPGKPLWFGVATTGQTLVFGLPGNPVSSMVCFELFVRPTLQAVAGGKPTGLEQTEATLHTPFHKRASRPTFFPSRLYLENNQTRVQPLPWKGSADQRTLTDANCLAYFPADQNQYDAGDTILVYRL
ncbi:MAG: molybdopterin molybdotransferase MoeA, partial [Planctomycetaceae bacterium]|nr:molybdopterin molybdotransferase MoeA [Planctomycetaceae bacterium]MCP4815424.1 molybdopterin molybdotransferase MoeA [Planctomycetaceae bacterium]